MLLTLASAASQKELKTQFDSLKMEYLRAVLNSDKEKEFDYLKKLIELGSKIKEDTTKYKKELTKLNKPAVKQLLIKENKQPNEVLSVHTTDNEIILNFNQTLTEKEIHFFELHINNVHKDVFDFQATFKDAYGTKLKIADVDKISIGQYKKDILRISIANKKNLTTIYTINEKQIIIKILDLNKREKIPVYKNIKEVLQNKNLIKQVKKTIVIDPGHGGKDSGAIGPHKRYEKTIVLNIAKYLNRLLKRRGYEVYLTRNSDKFKTLKYRTTLSNHKNADIFISIHANAVPKINARKTKGIETFFLSPARSERAKRVAALENKSDMNAMNNNSQMTFLTILNQSKITASQKLAIDVQQNLLYNARQQYKDVEDMGVREGPFWVLVGAQMPSILIEVGYISHPVESRRLYMSSYQKQLALGIANGIDSYFSKNF
ncbi:MAG: N-acetylmuramoyl-L-alanine amidase family protein [Candidatus Marinarcus sp.]|uniref:N-acetylmuramoyl-L-alanine amidase family protein n=1 Tax=Candidatus Marinarcus sp. TaxID=3100987 RepID=UPI003AFFC5E0